MAARSTAAMGEYESTFPPGVTERLRDGLKPDSPNHDAVEFWYRVQGEPMGEVLFNDPEAARHGYYYGRVFTQNSFAADLVKCLVGVSFDISWVLSNAEFCASLMFADNGQTTSFLVRYCFIVCYVVAIITWIAFAAYLTCAYLRTDLRYAADWIHFGWHWKQLFPFSSLLFFTMFNVPRNLWHAPVYFHPRKPFEVHRYMLTIGTRPEHPQRMLRGWVLGWPSKSWYTFETSKGKLVQLPKLILNMPLVFVQVTLVAKGNIGVVGWFTLMVTVVMFIVSLKDVCDVCAARHNFHKQLKRKLAQPLGPGGEGSAGRNALLSLYEQHFCGDPPAAQPLAKPLLNTN